MLIIKYMSGLNVTFALLLKNVGRIIYVKKNQIINRAALFPEGLAMMRVIPVESAVKDIPGTEPWERLSYYLDKYDTFSVSDCSCRQLPVGSKPLWMPGHDR